MKLGHSYIFPVLNIHGEVLESLAPPNTTLEEAFLPTLKSVHERFPKLRIVVSTYFFAMAKFLSESTC